MLPDRVSNLLTYESGALPIALRGPALCVRTVKLKISFQYYILRFIYNVIQIIWIKEEMNNSVFQSKLQFYPK